MRFFFGGDFDSGFPYARTRGGGSSCIARHARVCRADTIRHGGECPELQRAIRCLCLRSFKSYLSHQTFVGKMNDSIEVLIFIRHSENLVRKAFTIPIFKLSQHPFAASDVDVTASSSSNKEEGAVIISL